MRFAFPVYCFFSFSIFRPGQVKSGSNRETDTQWWINCLFTSINKRSYYWVTVILNQNFTFLLYWMSELNPGFFADSVTSLPGNDSSDVLNVTDYIGLLDKSREAGKDFFFLKTALSCLTLITEKQVKPCFCSFSSNLSWCPAQPSHQEWYRRRDCYRGPVPIVDWYRLCFNISS